MCFNILNNREKGGLRLETLGDRLRLARQKKGFKQTDVKERTKINNKTLSGYENNVSEPDITTLTELAELYEVSLEWLSTGAIEKKSDNPLTDKDERDIAKRMEKMKKDLIEGNQNGEGLNFRGEPMSEEAMESLLEALEHAERIATLANKKFAPNKYREKN